jgi:hypothetical protein
MTIFEYGTPQNDEREVTWPMAFTYDALAGLDTLSLGTSLRREYTITQASDGAVWVDSVSGASAILNAKLYNVDSHPEVVDRSKSPEQVFVEFMSMWDT